MAKCADCKKPISRGNTRRVPNGKTTKGVCLACYARIKANGGQSVKANGGSTHPYKNIVPDAPPVIVPDARLNLLPCSLIVSGQEIERVKKYFTKGYSSLGLICDLVDASLPEREPERFRGKYEVRLEER